MWVNTAESSEKHRNSEPKKSGFVAYYLHSFRQVISTSWDLIVFASTRVEYSVCQYGVLCKKNGQF